MMKNFVKIFRGVEQTQFSASIQSRVSHSKYILRKELHFSSKYKPRLERRFSSKRKPNQGRAQWFKRKPQPWLCSKDKNASIYSCGSILNESSIFSQITLCLAYVQFNSTLAKASNNPNGSPIHNNHQITAKYHTELYGYCNTPYPVKG